MLFLSSLNFGSTKYINISGSDNLSEDKEKYCNSIVSKKLTEPLIVLLFCALMNLSCIAIFIS